MSNPIKDLANEITAAQKKAINAGVSQSDIVTVMGNMTAAMGNSNNIAIVAGRYEKQNESQDKNDVKEEKE